MDGKSVINRLKKKIHASTDRELSTLIGVSIPGIQVWKRRKAVTQLQIAGLVFNARKAGATYVHNTAIRPIVEFFPINKSESLGGANYELFSVKADTVGKHPYLDGLRNELQTNIGIYIFFDSRGQAIYVGKARRQKLWKEINLAFNRKRGDVQSIKRVNHPAQKRRYLTSDEKARQIRDIPVPLHELARYFSTYQVVYGMIDTLEAMLVRSFANNLLNKRMERFAKKAKKKKTR